MAWTNHGDLADADAMPLAGREEIDGPTPRLTASEALDLAALARLASEVTGRPVTRKVTAESALERHARRNGVPEGAIAVMLGYFRAARAGEFDLVDPTLTRLLGRPPTRVSSASVMARVPGTDRASRSGLVTTSASPARKAARA